MSFLGVKLVTFDATNTLLKFRVPPWQYYAMAARDHGFTGTENDVKRKLKQSFKMMWEKHPNFGKNTMPWQDWWRQVVGLSLKDFLPEKSDVLSIANKLISDFRTTKCWNVAAGGCKLLRALHERGVSIGVISNFDPRLKDVLKNLDVHKYLDFVVTSYETGYSKPDKRIFDKALEMSKKKVKPHEALHIGDDFENDYQGAKAAGWHALLITENVSEKPLAKGCVFNNLDELSDVVEKCKLKL